MRPVLLIVIGCSCAALVAPARGEDLHGRLLLGYQHADDGAESLAASLGERHRDDALGDFRLSWTPKTGPWRFALDYQLTADAGDSPLLALREGARGFDDETPPLTQFDLTDTLAREDHFSASHRLDRLSVGYSKGPVVIRVGRQALTWGSGLVFHPMDIINPFAPVAVDAEYKPGTDMIYGQYLFNSGADLELVLAPRPDEKGEGPSGDASSFALHHRRAIGALQSEWLIARDHGDWTFAAGFGGHFHGAAWNVEIVPTRVDGGDVDVSALANASFAFTWDGRNVTAFAEYFHNGFGVGHGGYAIDALPAPLADRLLRGQTFNARRNYLALGATVQITPLFEASPAIIQNLDDGGRYWSLQATYSLKQNLDFVFGVQAPQGGTGTEFGGLPLTGAAAPYVAPSRTIYGQLRRYF